MAKINKQVRQLRRKLDKVNKVFGSSITARTWTPVEGFTYIRIFDTKDEETLLCFTESFETALNFVEGYDLSKK